jgi:hypothetical protein
MFLILSFQSKNPYKIRRLRTSIGESFIIFAIAIAIVFPFVVIYIVPSGRDFCYTDDVKEADYRPVSMPLLESCCM